MCNGDYMLNYEVDHKENNREKREAENDKEETNVYVKTRTHHTGGKGDGMRETSRTGFLSADVTGEQREEEYSSLRPQPIKISLVNLTVPCDTHRWVL